MDWLSKLSFGQAVLYAAGLVAVVGCALALITPAGRNAFAVLGLRVADALVALLERMLSGQQRAARRMR